MNEVIQSLLQAGLIDSQAAEFLAQQIDGTYAKDSAEARLLEAVLGALQSQQASIIGNIDDVLTVDQAAALFDTTESVLADAILPVAKDIATERAIASAVSLSTELTDSALEAAFMRVNESVLAWADSYYTSLDDSDVGSVPNLDATSRRLFLEVFDLWNRGELPTQQEANRGLPNLIQALEPVFGPTRVERIAVTEATRIFGESAKFSGRASDVITGLRWSTANDELVCPVCGPLDGLTIPVDGDVWQHPTMGGIRHPAHPRCRCDLIPVTELAQ